MHESTDSFEGRKVVDISICVTRNRNEMQYVRERNFDYKFINISIFNNDLNKTICLCK